MPFTVSHVAAVLPFGGTRLIAPALVVGSVAPDIPYYLDLPLMREQTHTLSAVTGGTALWQGALALVLWYVLLAKPVRAAAPAGLRCRWPEQRVAVTPLWLVLAYMSLAIGGLTHVGWDSFTHAGTWGTEQVGWLKLKESHGGVRGYLWAQYASGLFGLVALGVFSWRWWRRTPPGNDPGGLQHPLLAWVAVLGTAAVVGAAAGWSWVVSGHGVSGLGFITATRGIAAGASIALLLSFAWHATSRRRKEELAPDVEDQLADRSA